MDRWPPPEGWEWKTMGTVVTTIERRDPSGQPDRSFVYIDIASIDNAIGTIRDPKAMVGRDAPSRARQVVNAFDVIFATTRPYLRNIAIVPEDYAGQICSTGFCVLRADRERMLPRYLYHACRSAVVVDQLMPRMRGANYPAVSDRDVLDCEIPIPYPHDPPRSLEIQRRIVARLDALFAEIGEARKLQASIREDTDQLKDAVLKDTFDSLRGAYHEVLLGDQQICRIIPGQHIMSQDYRDSPPGVPYVTGPADFGDKFPTITKWTLQPKVLSQPGDVLFTVKGSGVGKVNCAPLDSSCAIGRQVMAIRPIEHRIATDFLFYGLLGRFREFQMLRQGAAIPGIRKEHVEAISLPLPDWGAQIGVATRLDAIMTEMNVIVATDVDNERLITDLERSILTQAFRGEL